MSKAIKRFLLGFGVNGLLARLGFSIILSLEICKFCASLVSLSLCRKVSYNFLLLSTSLEKFSILASLSSISLNSFFAFSKSVFDKSIKFFKLLNSNTFL